MTLPEAQAEIERLRTAGLCCGGVMIVQSRCRQRKDVGNEHRS